jgi:hypothetical protein
MNDRGSAVVEFLVIGVVVLVPIAYLVQAVMAVQAADLATATAAREAARAFSSAVTPAEGQARARAAARLAFADQDLQVPDQALRLSCVDGPCLAPGSAVLVAVDWTVPLPWLPGDWGTRVGVPVSALQRVPIDEYRPDP